MNEKSIKKINNFFDKGAWVFCVTWIIIFLIAIYSVNTFVGFISILWIAIFVLKIKRRKTKGS